MKKIIYMTAILLATAKVSASSLTPNKDLISIEVLGKMFCYETNPGYGWAFFPNGTSVKIGQNLGMPGPDDYYTVSFPEGPRAVGLFWAQNSQERVNFQVDSDSTVVQLGPNGIFKLSECK